MGGAAGSGEIIAGAAALAAPLTPNALVPVAGGFAAKLGVAFANGDGDASEIAGALRANVGLLTG
jgi:hypothetical protein